MYVVVVYKQPISSPQEAGYKKRTHFNIITNRKWMLCSSKRLSFTRSMSVLWKLMDRSLKSLIAARLPTDLNIAFWVVIALEAFYVRSYMLYCPTSQPTNQPSNHQLKWLSRKEWMLSKNTFFKVISLLVGFLSRRQSRTTRIMAKASDQTNN